MDFSWGVWEFFFDRYVLANFDAGDREKRFPQGIRASRGWKNHRSQHFRSSAWRPACCTGIRDADLSSNLDPRMVAASSQHASAGAEHLIAKEFNTSRDYLVRPRALKLSENS